MRHVSKRLFAAALLLAVGCDDGGELRDHRDDGGDSAAPAGPNLPAPPEGGGVAEDEGETQDPRCSLPRWWRVTDSAVFRHFERDRFGPGEHLLEFYVHQRLLRFDAVAFFVELRRGREPFVEGFKLGRFEYSAADGPDPGLYLWAGGDRFSVDDSNSNFAFRQVYEVQSATVTITERETDTPTRGGARPVHVAIEGAELTYKDEEGGFECKTSVESFSFEELLVGGADE